MDGEASNVVLYQKYAVAEDLSHSGTTVPFTNGHFSHGSGYYDKIPFYLYIQ